MEILQSLEEDIFAPSCLSLGNFDGVHLGHRVLIHETVEFAKRHDLRSVIATFKQHPTRKKVLTLLDEKINLIEQLGPDALLLLDYEEVGDWSGERFLEFLRDDIGVRHLISGPDHTFGRHGSSSPVEILKNPHKWQMGVTVFQPMRFRGVFVKSGEIRSMIEAGQVEDAAYFLGGHYKVSGRVIAGRGLGSDMGYPTANLRVNPRKLLPKDGVYIVRASGEPGLCHIGPRFPDGVRTVEVHILSDAVGDITGITLEVMFLKRLRDVMKFKEQSELAKQIAADISQAGEFFQESES